MLVSSSFFPKIDGSTRCVYDHARKLAELGNTVYLLTRGMPGVPKAENIEGIRVVRTSFSFSAGTIFNKVGLIVEQMATAINLQRKKRFSVIHVHGYTSGLAAIPCRYLFGVPVVITTHGTELLWPRRLRWKSNLEVKLGLIFERFILNQCDVIVAQSEGVRRYMIEIYGKKIEQKITLIHTGVDHQKFSAPERSSASKQILFVGALSEIKGVSCLLNAFAKLHESSPDTKLVLVGSGPRARDYKEYVRRMNLNGSVVFQGPVRDDQKLLELYRAADIVVLPSNVGGPISCTILEGLSCGRAVISTNVPGGIPDVLAGGVGLLMERGDEEQLAQFLKRLTTDPEYLKMLEHNARRAVEDNYTLDSMIEKLTALYAGLAN